MPERFALPGLIPFLLLACVSGAAAQTISLSARLLGSSNVPQTGSDAFGEGQFTYDDATRQLDYYLTYDGATPVRIDLHGPAAAAEKAPAIASFPVSGSPMTGKIALTPEQGEALLSGKIYVDLHSQKYADGEIRGQIRKD